MGNCDHKSIHIMILICKQKNKNKIVLKLCFDCNTNQNGFFNGPWLRGWPMVSIGAWPTVGYRGKIRTLSLNYWFYLQKSFVDSIKDVLQKTPTKRTEKDVSVVCNVLSCVWLIITSRILYIFRARVAQWVR